MAQAKGVQARLLRFEDPESAYGTDPSSAHSISLPFNPPLNFQSRRNLIDPNTITGRRDPVEPIQGRIDLTGSVVVPVDQYAIGYWLQALLGTPTVAFTGSAKTHVFKVNSSLPSFAYEVGMTDVGAYNKMRGVKVAGATLRFGDDEELTMSFDLVGQVDVPGTSTMSSRITTVSLTRYNQYNAILTEGGAALDGKIRNGEIVIQNNLDTDMFTVSSGGSATRGNIAEGLCMVSGRMSMMFENWSYYARAMSGTERSLALKFQTGSFYLEFDIGELIFERTSPPIDTPLGIWQDLPFKAFYKDDADASVVMVTLVNTWAAYSGHL